MSVATKHDLSSTIPESKLPKIRTLTSELSYIEAENEQLTSTLQCVLDLLPVGVIMYDPDNVLVLWNRVAESLLGPPYVAPLSAWETVWTLTDVQKDCALSMREWPMSLALKGHSTDRLVLKVSRNDVQNVNDVIVSVCARPVVCPRTARITGGMLAFRLAEVDADAACGL